MKSGLPAALVVLCAVLVAGVWCETASATVNFTGTATSHTMSGIRGARSHIQRYNPRVSGNPLNCSSAWVMVDNYEAVGGYAQVGWVEFEDHGNNPYYFWEFAYANGSDPGPILTDLVPNGGNYTGADDLCTVEFVDGSIKYRLNGAVQHTTTSPDWTPDQAQYLCEIHAATGETAPQIGGDSNHKVDYDVPAYYSSDTWHALNPDPLGTNNTRVVQGEGRYVPCGSSDNPRWFKVYDNRYHELP